MDFTINQALVDTFVEGNTLEEALEDLTIEIKDRIELALTDCISEYGLFEILQQFNDDLHRMDELDDVYDSWRPTEILEELTDIDLYDDYFNGCTNRSGSDIWSVADVEVSDVVCEIYNKDLYLDSYGEYEIFEEIFIFEKNLKEAIVERFKVYDKAKELFDMAMEKDPHEVMTLLWSMGL